MRYIVMSLLMGVLSFLSVASQAQLREAHEAYDMYEFEEAARLYKRVVDRNMDGKGIAMERLGDCYRFLGDIPEAETWYARTLAENPNVANRTYLNYALVLRDVGKYAEAKDFFLKYASYVPSDTKGDLYAGYMDQVLEWKKEKKPIEVRNLIQLNTEYDDYYTVFTSEGYVFASDRPADGSKPKKKAKSGPTKLWVSKGQVNGNWIDLDFPTLFIAPTKKNAKEELGAASFTKDMSRMYFSRQYEIQNSFGDIVVGLEIVYRDKQPNGEWGEPRLFPFNSKEYSTAQPSISPDGKSLYFVSDMSEGYGATDIYVSKITNGQFERPRNLGANINTAEVEKYPVAVDDTTLYFSSNGHITYGGLDILKSTYRDGAWQKPENLREPINSKFNDYAFTPIKGDILAIFSSERSGGKGGVDLYVVTPEERPLYVAGKVFNAENKTISNVNINIQNTKDEADKKEVTTQKNGDYAFSVKGGGQYLLTFAQQGLSTEKITVNAKTDDAVFDTIKAPDVVMRLAVVEPVEQRVAEKTPVVEPVPVVKPEPTPEPEPVPVAVVEIPAPVVE
ncbi:MAG: carboxypeptidase regulatory-like domain-containing protein, partial [Prevotellaceae bacterium]|nr:carboxypeptidase regulatory-like domain-containing protein [Prevotellaceae bacterium]